MRDDAAEIDDDLFPTAFLRLLAIVHGATRRLHAGGADGRRRVRGEGGRFLFRGHRAYRPGDDPARVDWKVEARLGRLEVRQYDPERDVRTEVWLDSSASMGWGAGRRAGAQAAALAAATSLGEGGQVKLGVVRDGSLAERCVLTESQALRQALVHLSQERPGRRAGWEQALPLLVRRVPRSTRLIVISDFLTRADPGVLHALAGRGVRGAVLHLRMPEVYAPEAGLPFEAVDVESGVTRLVELDEHAAARVAHRARAHADLWAHHARLVGLHYLPFGPELSAEELMRRLILEVS